MPIDQQRIKAELYTLHIKLAINLRLRRDICKTLTAIHTNRANACRLIALRRQYQSQQQGSLDLSRNLNYELQTKHYQLLVELHQERSNQYDLMASDLEEMAVAHEKLAHHYAVTTQDKGLKTVS